MENKADKQLKFIELRAKGNSFDRISKKLGVSKKHANRMVQTKPKRNLHLIQYRKRCPV